MGAAVCRYRGSSFVFTRCVLKRPPPRACIPRIAGRGPCMEALPPLWTGWAAGQWVWKTREFSAVAIAQCCPRLSMSWRSWKSLSSSTNRVCACTLQHTLSRQDRSTRPKFRLLHNAAQDRWVSFVLSSAHRIRQAWAWQIRRSHLSFAPQKRFSDHHALLSLQGQRLGLRIECIDQAACKESLSDQRRGSADLQKRPRRAACCAGRLCVPCRSDAMFQPRLASRGASRGSPMLPARCAHSRGSTLVPSACIREHRLSQNDTVVRGLMQSVWRLQDKAQQQSCIPSHVTNYACDLK